MATIKEPCGCKSNDREWTERCPTHKAEDEAHYQRYLIDSFNRICQDYDANPTPEILRCVVDRIKAYSHLIRLDARLMQWIVDHKILLLTVKAAQEAHRE